MSLLGYIRVDGQDARPQLAAVMSAGVEPLGVYSDVFSDGKGALDSPALQRLLDCSVEGDTVVVWRIDRLGRSLSEVLDTVTLIRERGIHLRSLQDGIDSRTAQGRLMLSLLGSLAEYDRHLASERIAAVMASSRQTGTRLGRPPADPEAIRDKIRAVEDARARGLSAADAAHLVGWSRATFYRHQKKHGSQE